MWRGCWLIDDGSAFVDGQHQLSLGPTPTTTKATRISGFLHQTSVRIAHASEVYEVLKDPHIVFHCIFFCSIERVPLDFLSHCVVFASPRPVVADFATVPDVLGRFFQSIGEKFS